MKRCSRIALAIVASAGAAAAMAQTANTAPAVQQDGPPAAGGLTVFKDPLTGALRQPDAAEIGALLPSRASGPVVQRALPNGGYAVKLDQSFESFMVITKRPDGTLAWECVTGDAKASEVMARGVQGTPLPSRKRAADVE